MMRIKAKHLTRTLNQNQCTEHVKKKTKKWRTKEWQLAGWHKRQEFFCFKMLGTHGIHGIFTLLIRYLGNACITLVLPHFQLDAV